MEASSLGGWTLPSRAALLRPPPHSGLHPGAPGLPKTRSGKTMRRILRKIAANEHRDLGDIPTLAEPAVVEDLVDNRMSR